MGGSAGSAQIPAQLIGSSSPMPKYEHRRELSPASAQLRTAGSHLICSAQLPKCRCRRHDAASAASPTGCPIFDASHKRGVAEVHPTSGSGFNSSTIASDPTRPAIVKKCHSHPGLHAVLPVPDSMQKYPASHTADRPCRPTAEPCWTLDAASPLRPHQLGLAGSPN